MENVNPSFLIFSFIQAISKEIAKIKSIQLEFVKHSLLTRKNIKIEKEVEVLKEEQLPKSHRVKYVLQGIRVRLLQHYTYLHILILFSFIVYYSLK